MLDAAISDYTAAITLHTERAIPLHPQRPGIQNPQLIQNAIELDLQHPTYLTVLALAYARNGEFDKAVSTQKRALESPRFPPGYREEATDALKEYERALAGK